MLKFYKYRNWVENLFGDENYLFDEVGNFIDIDLTSITLFDDNSYIRDLTSIKLFEKDRWLFATLAQNPSDIAMAIINQHIGNLNNSMDKRDALFKNTLINLCYNTNDIAIDILEKYEKYLSKNNWACLCFNTNNKGIELCKKNNNIDMFYLSSNRCETALDILCDNMDKIDWCELSSNENDRAIELLKQNPEKIDWSYLCRNSNDKVYDLLLENQGKISWIDLLVNKNSKILGLYDNNMDKMNDDYWIRLCENNCDKALKILEANQDKINWNVLASNNNDKAIKLLSENIDKICVEYLFENTNPKVLDLIMKKGIKNLTRIDGLIRNPNIFTYNYEAIKEHMKSTWLLDLLKYWHHPKSAYKWVGWGWDDYPDFDNFGL